MTSVADEAKKFDALVEYLHRDRGFDFSGYKRSSLERRIRKRMQDVGVAGFGNYLDYLEVHPEEFTQLFNTILINVTAFFRDPAAWEYLAKEIIPQIVGGKRVGEPIRVWSAGCASGQEPYTLAMILSEALGTEAVRQRVKIYATDIDEDALNHARQASYGDKALEPVPAALRDTYFHKAGNRHVFKPDLRRSIIFGRHDLVQHAPISRIDLLVCRNTLMYFNAETQNRILARLHFALNDKGFLFLGHAEMLLTRTNLFRPVELKHRIFAKVAGETAHEGLQLPPRAAAAGADTNVGREIRIREVAFDTAPVAQVMIDPTGLLVLANDRARSLFGLHSTDVGRPFHDLEISYRPLELRSLIDQAVSEALPVSAANVQRRLPDGEVQCFDVQVVPLKEGDGTWLGVTIIFHDVTRDTRLRDELRQAHARLEVAYEELQSTNEELETTNEELQSSNEELETTNEELQSSNEELETMNEELQSSNEELRTLNDELRMRTEDVDRANAFLASILSGLRAAVVVVDGDLAVREWNRKAEDLWGLRADEVHGKPLLDLDIGLPMDRLGEYVRASLEDGAAERDVVLDATNRRGRAFRCRVGSAPHRDADGRRLGLILLMEEEGAA